MECELGDVRVILSFLGLEGVVGVGEGKGADEGAGGVEDDQGGSCGRHFRCLLPSLLVLGGDVARWR